MARYCREALGSDAAPGEKLRHDLGASIEDLTTRAEPFLLFSESQYLASIPEAKDIVSNADVYGKKLLAIIEDGVAAGVIRWDLDSRLVMLGILGMHNWIHCWYVPGGRNSVTEIGNSFAAMAVSGLRP